MTFASLECTAKAISFAHASAPQMTWEPLGSMGLRSHGDSRLQHVIKLGAHTQIQRYLRITLVGLLQSPGSGEHLWLAISLPQITGLMSTQAARGVRMPFQPPQCSGCEPSCWL